MATATKRATQDTAPIFRNPQNHVLIKQLLYLCLVTAPAYRFKFELVSACGTEIRLAYKLHTSRPHRRFRSQDRFSLQCVKRPFLRSINTQIQNTVITESVCTNVSSIRTCIASDAEKKHIVIHRSSRFASS